MVNVAVYLPDGCPMPHPLGSASVQHAYTHRIEHDGSERIHVVSFVGLPEHIDVALQVIGESVRIPGAWATVGGQRMSSLVALWNRLDCYRQSLPVTDRVAYCKGKAASLRAKLGCEAPSCSMPCQFICPECTVMGSYQTASLVDPETQMLFVFGEVDWCPNLKRPAQL